MFVMFEDKQGEMRPEAQRTTFPLQMFALADVATKIIIVKGRDLHLSVRSMCRMILHLKVRFRKQSR